MKKHKKLPPLDPLRRYSVPEALDYLGISRGWFYQRVANGEIPVIRDGKRAFVSGATIVAHSQPASA